MKVTKETLQAEVRLLGALMYKIECRNLSETLYRYKDGPTRGFLSDTIKALNADARTMRFAGEIAEINPRFVGTMRKSTINSLDLLEDYLSRTPSAKARNRHLGLRPYDVERTWFLNRFNTDANRITKDLPSAGEDPARFLKCSSELFYSYATNIYRPFSQVYRECLRNILGSGAKDMGALIEENFGMGTVYDLNGRKTADFRYLRKLIREKKYKLNGTEVVFSDGDRKLKYNVWDLVFMALFLQRKAMLLCCLFCLFDIDADGRRLG